jgi:FdhD protein
VSTEVTGGAVAIPVRRDDYTGAGGQTTRAVPLEVPIAIELNGVAYAVMMATPLDLADFITGFLLAEGLAEAGEIEEPSFHPVEGEAGCGIVARLNLPAHRAAPLMERARRRLGDSSCGICGIESVELALRPLPRLPAAPPIASAAIRRGLAAMREAQVLGRETAATHAAALCRADGALVALREDVGRHNALDKLVGALVRSGADPASGFIAVTSRCSYELVEKTVRAGCPLLVAISAPTSLAVDRARAAGLTLGVLARDDSLLWVE